MEGSVDTPHQNRQGCWLKDMNNIKVNSGIQYIPSLRRRSGYIVRSRFPWSPTTSPSTDSTTSLAQLHDKLKALPSVNYNKITFKISTTPKLPTVREVGEHDDLSNVLPKHNFCGVAKHYKIENKGTSLAKNRFLASQSANQGYQSENENTIPLVERRLRAYQSDTETNTVVKKTGCISPSFQLHDKLRALPSLMRNKISPKISITPELPTVRGVSEHDDLSNIVSKRNLVGVARHYTSENKAANKNYQSENENTIPLVEKSLRAYQSDTETKPVDKKTRRISPVNKENPPTLINAAQGKTYESVINDTFDKNDKLCKDNIEYDLIDVLVKEALQNDQQNDSGVSTKRTQESDVIENTPVENIAHQKKNVNRVKHTVVSNTTTDESNTDVIDDTPCYVFDRKKRDKTDATKNVNTFDAAIVDTFFSQHMNQNNEGIYISPTLAKTINKTNSEASGDDNADKAIFREEVEVVIVDFLDKVCSNLDKDTDLMNETQQHIDTLCKVQHFDESSSVSSDISNTKSNTSFMDNFEKDIEHTKKIALKFNLSKNGRPKLNKKQQNPKNIKQPNKVDEDCVIIETANENSPSKNLTLKMNIKQQNPKNTKLIKVHEDCLLIEQNLNANSPENMTKSMITRKKRKLYSPKDGDNDNHEIPRIRTESRQSNINKTPMATCYRELEKARKSRIRLPRKSRVSTEPLTSPKTKKLNDLFDKIKEHVDNEEKISLADKSKLRNKKDLTLYNLSSESDDQDFKEKKIKVQNRVSSSSLESSANKRSRVVKLPDHYAEFDYRALCSSEDEERGTKKPKIIKHSKPKSRKVKKKQNITLIDEKMRQVPPEVLETSFIKETVTTKPEVVEPAIQQVPVLESIPDDINNIVTDTIVPENRAQTLNKSDILKIKKEKGITQRNEKAVVTKRGKVPNKREINKHVPKEQDSATVSPLPGLVVETEQLHIPSRQLDISSSIEANLLQKFKKIYVQNLSETDATQNLLQNANIYNDADVGLNERIKTVVLTDNSSERSIATVGRSPITAHNDLNESPPNVDLLHERFQHRDVDIEEMSRDLTEFLDNMRNQMNCKSDAIPVNTLPVLPLSRMSSKRSINKHSTASVKSSATIPVVVLKRLSTREIETNLNLVVTPSRRSQIRSSKVLSKASSKEIGKYQSPNTSSSIRSPQVVLDRLSFDDINKWLPIPQLKNKVANEIPKEHKKKQTPKKLVGIAKTTPDKVKGKKLKSLISPVKLNFESFEKTDFSVQKAYNTRSSTKSIQSLATKVDKNKDEAIIFISQKSSNTKTTEKYGKENDIKNTQKSVEAANATNALRKDGTICAVGSDDTIANSPENIARVQDWFKRNISTSTSGKADNDVVDEIILKVTEALDTTLTELHQSMHEKRMRYYLENLKHIKAIELDLHRKLKEMEKMLTEGACQLLREEAEKKALIVRLLREEIQAMRPDRRN